MKSMYKQLFLLLICYLWTVLGDWTLNLEYSTTGVSFEPLGIISLNQRSDGNYTGVFRPKPSVAKSLRESLLDVSKKPNEFYYVKADNIRSFNYPCLLLRSNLAHTFALTIDMERRQVLSMTVFPQGIYDAGKDQLECDGIEVPANAQVTGNVVITRVGELPAPDTASYLSRIEDEKRARQHGAGADNRSFLAKYWMYIVPVVIFMVVQNAFSAGEEGQAQ